MSVQETEAHQHITEQDIEFLQRISQDYGTRDGAGEDNEKVFHELCEKIGSCANCRAQFLGFHSLHL